MSTDLMPFKFDTTTIRTMTNDGAPMFCGKDVAAALGYKDRANALKLHCKGVAKYHPLKTAGGTQQVRFIGEADLYRLIFNSKLPAAERFERWVVEEVLPAIRKHGGYLTPAKVEEALLNPDTLIRLATNLKEEQEKRRALEAQIEADRPKTIFADAVATSSSTCLVGELAKMLCGNGIDIGQNRLFEWLRQNGYLISRGGSDKNMPTQRSMDMKLFRIKETAVTHSDGHVTVSRTPKVTGKGQAYFINLFLDEQRQAERAS